MKSESKILKTSLLLSFIVLLFFTARVVDAATLYFSPSSGNFSDGNIFTVSLLVNTQGQAINNAEAILNFPSDFLEVTSVSKFGSIFSLWVQEPSFSNGAGTVSFNGGLPTPGYTGSSGKILDVVFRVKRAGIASFISTSAAVRANDGYGTDILTNTPQASFTLLTEEAPAPPATEKPIDGAPAAPEIFSSTHPDPDAWYAKNVATFTWLISDEITATRLLFGKIPAADPIVLYAPPISTKTIDGLEDGIWYFHAQLKNDYRWGRTAHFRLQVDTKNPDRFNITLAPRENLTEPTAQLIFDAHDEMSGIDHYEITIDGKDSIVWHGGGNSTFKTPVLSPGSHMVVAKAVDRAGNSLTNSIEFVIKPLEAPIITEYPRTLENGEILYVQGTTYPNAKVTVWLQKDDKAPNMYSVKSDGAGNFTFVNDEGLASDVYKLWALVTDSRGASSDPSEKVTLTVKQPTFLKIGTFAIGLLSILIPLLGLIIFLIFMLWYGWRKFVNFKRRLRKEVSDVERDLHKAFDLLREDIREQIKMLEKAKTKRQLTKEEERVIRQLRKDLDDAERFIKKEVEEIEDVVK